KAKNQGLLLETAEHQRQPPVLRDVSSSLALAPGHVEVSDATVVQDAKRVQPFGRDIDAPLVGSRGIEEHLLGRDEIPQGLVQFGVELRHAGTPEIPVGQTSVRVGHLRRSLYRLTEERQCQLRRASRRQPDEFFQRCKTKTRRADAATLALALAVQ